jgi:hypothetical protein
MRKRAIAAPHHAKNVPWFSGGLSVARRSASVVFPGHPVTLGAQCDYSAAIIRSSSAADRIGSPSIDLEGRPSTPTSGRPTSVIR